MSPAFITLPIFVLTVVLSLAQPTIGRVRLHHGWAAVLGAGLMLLLLPGLADEILLPSIQILARPLLTIVSLMVITILARRAGLFHWMLVAIVRASGGDGRRLFFWLFVGGVVTGAIFTNDAAVLILTPLVCLLVSRWTGRTPLPFLFAVLNIANLVAVFVISNPINIVVADYFGIDFLHYALWMLLPSAAAAVSTYLVLRIWFRREIAEAVIPADSLPDAARTPFFLPCLLGIVVTVVAAFLGPLAGVRLSVVAAVGAAVLLGLGYRLDGIRPREVFRQVAWDVLIFVAGFFVIVNGLKMAGITAAIGGLIRDLSGGAPGPMIYATGVIAAVCSALMNNHPTAYLMALSITDLAASPRGQSFLAFAMLIGGDLGPKMLPIGSLAALLWFRLLRDNNIRVPYTLYIKIGVPVTLLALLLALTMLVLEMRLFGALAAIG